MIRIGVDVGGTNTDCAILQGTEVVGSAKFQTTKDVISGIVGAVNSALADCNPQVDIDKVRCIMIGTTHFVNAVVQRSNELCKVGLIRLCGNATFSLPPYTDWPKDLAEIVNGGVEYVAGGYNITGSEVSEFNDEEVVSACQRLVDSGSQIIVLCGVFSPLRSKQEEEASALLRSRFPDLRIKCSYDIGQLGLLERENSAVLNASLLPMAEKIVRAYKSALKGIGLKCPLLLSQNDGTVVNADFAAKFPVFTFLSGPTNSMRGAAFLSHVTDAVVVDIGGTTTDVGVLKGSFPREASKDVRVGGVKTNFRLPDVESIGIGGGSLVVKHPKGVKVGPKSVGYRIVKEAVVFGGSTITATDVCVSAGLSGDMKIGDASRLGGRKADMEEVEEGAIEYIRKKVEELVDTMKTEEKRVDIVLVGGGSILLNGCVGEADEAKENDYILKGVSKVLKPSHFEVANAVGAAMSQVSGSVDSMYSGMTREEAYEKAEFIARENCIRAGGDKATLDIIAKEDIPLSYIPGDTRRVKVKVVGDLNIDGMGSISESESELEATLKEETTETTSEAQKTAETKEEEEEEEEEVEVEHLAAPTIDHRVWKISRADIKNIAVGAQILGTGGGGSAYISQVRAFQLMDKGYELNVISPENLRDEDLVICCGGIGAPTVIVEKPFSGHECLNAIDEVEKITGKKTAALLPIEIGGMNSIEPMLYAAQKKIPVVDMDGMGRAFPEVHMITMYMYLEGASPPAAVMCDENGRRVTFEGLESPRVLEEKARAEVINMGLAAGIAMSFTGKMVKNFAVKHSISHAWKIGRAVRTALKQKHNPLNDLFNMHPGELLFSGKIVSVRRDTTGGFARGNVVVRGSGNEELTVEFQNENTVARLKNGKVIASVPDLICILDIESGEAYATEEVKYGLRVNVVCLMAHPLLRSEIALKNVSPASFGYPEVEYKPIAASATEWKGYNSIIDA